MVTELWLASVAGMAPDAAEGRGAGLPGPAGQRGQDRSGKSIP
jgi:hypothetical protein